MSETPAVPATEAAMRAAWTEVCMAEYRITGDMMKSAQFADRIEKTYRDQVRAQTLAEAEEKIREAAKGRPVTGLCPEISTATRAAFLLRTLRASEES
jgi:hypothetical protein